MDEHIWFPPLHEANSDGLLAAGGDLSTARLLAAYKNGIFPWFEGDIPLWWSPDPRFVLYPDRLYVSKSMRQVIRRHFFSYSQNKAFRSVIEHCGQVSRSGQVGTWLSPAMMDAYSSLHQLGFAHSFEAWHGTKLVGGLYGLRLGNLFFGESMFSLQANASKAAFIWAVQQLQASGVVLIDCQVYTQHLESLGAVFIDRNRFVHLLHEHIPKN